MITDDVIKLRPSGKALLRPLAWLLTGAACFATIIWGLERLPVWLLMALLLVAVVSIPTAGLGVVYSIVGAHVVIDRAKQSATWQQGAIGLGIGTQELVPFWKIAAIVVEEAGASAEGNGRRIEELAQYQIVLEKESGKRLIVGGVTAPRSLAAGALARASEVAMAIADLTGRPARLPVATAEPAGRPARAPAARTARRSRRRRSHHR